MGIAFIVGQNDTALGSGDAIGFYGTGGFGDPISLKSCQGRVFITTSGGTTQGLEIDNCKMVDVIPWSGVSGASGVIVGQVGSGIGILNLPNYLATLNVRFTNSTPVLVQGANILVHDGDGATAVSGLEIWMAEIIHTSTSQADTGTGDFAWQYVNGVGYELGLSDSPGVSGTFPLVPEDVQHDWYVAISARPTRPNPKLFCYTMSLEYL
jgi:hypothetical protein